MRSAAARANVPQLLLDVDRTRAQTLGIPLNDIFGTLSAYLGSTYVNDFSLFGRTYRVMIQADAAFRSRADDIRALDVRDADGNMIPLGTLLAVRDTVGPQAVSRYNLFPSATITGAAAPGFSAGEARQAMEALAAQTLPPSMGYEWTGTTYQQIAAGNQAPRLFALAFVLVFLFLAAQYESWLIPVAVILAIPFSLIGALYGSLLRAYDNNVYTQIGLVLLIGLSAKTAILIVEFARQLREGEGRTTLEAAVEAARLRFRAVLMTAVSFILGVLPLLVATGAGAASRRALGTAVFAGMVAATALGVLFIPVFYVLVQKARAAQALVDYERTLLNALEEVENAMVAYGREQDRRARLQQAVAASGRAVALVRTQYLAGLTDFQNVLDSQRTRFALGDQLADANGAVVQHLVRLYAALGGGWDVASTPGPAATR